MRHKIFIGLIVALVAAATAMAQKPYAQEDDTWITLNGIVVSTAPASIELDYGPQKITVVMDDWLDWYGQDTQILHGRNITVAGRIDDSWFTDRKIIAQTIYVNDFNTFFSIRDLEKDTSSGVVLAFTDMGDRAFVTGTVAGIKDRTFTINTESNKLTVNTDAMKYNPMDSSGYQMIEVGDRVQVSGDLDVQFFENDLLTADRIVTLSKNEKTTSSSKARGARSES